jgi:4-diphosphocytidyl-2-C-methyl-D-erythritol kinase
MPTRVRSYSKINLGLAVGPSRPDGFHALTTVYQTLQLHDLVTVIATPSTSTSIVLTSTTTAFPAPKPEQPSATPPTASSTVFWPA